MYSQEREYGRREKFGRDVTRDNEKSKSRAYNSRLRQGVFEQEDDDDYFDEDEYRGFGQDY